MADNSNTIGSGSDTIVLKMSGDAAVGVDPQFTLNVDGQQIGGVQDVSASHGAGQTQTFTFQGNFAPGPHDLTVTFANNFLMPEDRGSDRNLYVDGVTYDGQTVSNTTTPIYQSPLFPPNSSQGDILGNAVFKANDTTSIPSGAASTQSTTPSPVSIGSGSDTLVLNMAEDPYLGDAQFTVSVDGQQVGGTQTTTAVVSQGQQQEFDVHGNWGGGSHAVSVTFTNDKIGGFYPGTDAAIDTTDRNLYVMGAKLNDGPAASGLPWEIDTFGSRNFTVTSGSGGSSGASSGNSNSNNSDTSSGSGNVGDSGSSSASNNSGSGSTSSSDNGATAKINSDSLNANGSGSGSSSGMSFMSSSTDGGSASDGSGTNNNSWSGNTTDASNGTSSSALSGATPTQQDWTKPTWASSSDNGTSSGTSGGSSWWMAHNNTNTDMPAWQHG